MIGLKERVGVLPEVETDDYPCVLSGGVVRVGIDVAPSGTIRVVPSAVTELCRSVVESCLAPPLVGDALPKYRPSEIEYEGRRYIFREPLECEVSWELEPYFIRYRPFGITVASPVLSAAIEEFAFEFAHDYERYNEVSCADNKFGLRLGEHPPVDERDGCVGNRFVSMAVVGKKEAVRSICRKGCKAVPDPYAALFHPCRLM